MTKSERFWNKRAKKYDKKEKAEESTYGEYVEKIGNYLSINDNVLDFGCGTGLIGIGLSGNVKKIIAIDTSSSLIELAKNTAGEREIENIEFSCSSIFAADFEVESFDVILVLYIFHLLEDLPAALKRMNQLLKPNGKIISSTPCMAEKNRLLSAIISLGGYLGIFPKLNAFKLAELKIAITNAHFQILESELLDKSGQQYFIVAKKN
jgi:2-polyprenyl-3-methyl-5-hydroxy-6-metoxy-1,4-benzoquinol methylase